MDLSRQPTIGELGRHFLAQHEASPARIELLRHMVLSVADPIAHHRADHIGPTDIARWRAALSPPTRWQATQAVAQVTGWARRWQLIERDPFEHVSNPRPPQTEFVPFTGWAEIEAVAAELPANLALLPWLGAGCGLRPGELLGLTWDCVGIARKELTVRRTAWRGQLRSTLKTGRSKRIVPIRGRVLEQLVRTTPQQRTGLVFSSIAGTPLDLHNVRSRAWRPALQRAAIDHPHRIYDLRHTYATWSLRAGVSLFQLARRMGTSIDMIDATYGHLAADAAAHERELLDQWDTS